ncbi:hypothetical protein QFZ98_008254 [Paraburkholderia youngii]
MRERLDGHDVDCIWAPWAPVEPSECLTQRLSEWPRPEGIVTGNESCLAGGEASLSWLELTNVAPLVRAKSRMAHDVAR